MFVPKLGVIIPNMGVSKISAVGLSDALFAKTQRRVLGVLFGNPDRSYFSNEIVRMAESGIGAVHRELAALEAAGLVTVTRIGNQKHYQANQASPVFAELCALARKTFAMADPLREALIPLASRIEAAFVYGSVAKRADTVTSDIDLMVIADKISYGELLEALEPLADTIGRRVSPTTMSRREWAKRVNARSAFASRLMTQPKIWLIGSEDVLRV